MPFSDRPREIGPIEYWWVFDELREVAGESVDLHGELERRMKALDRESYEGVLRPAFQQDEWKLIAAGAVLGTVAGFLEFVIPENETRTFRGKWEIPKDISLLNVWPHMHYLGKNWDIVLERPDGSSENIIRINEWDFNWQGNYTFPKYIKAPAGSKIFASAKYDNTKDNIYNPSNPPESVNWGEKTKDEMFFLPFAYVDYREGDEHLSLDDFSPGDLPAFRIDHLTESEIQFRLQSDDREYVIEHSDDMLLWQRVSSTETSADQDWRTLTLPRTENSEGFYRAVIFQAQQ